MLLEKYWLELVFGLISAGALGFCKYLLSQIKDYKKILEQREQDVVVQTIDEKLEPVLNEIKQLELYIDEVANKEKQDISKILASWAFRITQLCELYLEQGYMLQSQYIQLVEMFSLYQELGGNGKIKELFDKTTTTVPIKKGEKLPCTE